MIFRDYGELYSRIRKLLLDAPEIESRNGKTKELQAFGFTLINPRNRLAYHKDRRFNLQFALFEFLCDVTGINDAQFTKAINLKAAEYSDDNLTFYGAYGPRISPNISKIIEILTEDKNSRQAIISIYNTNDMFAKTKDVPCTLSLQFLIRDDKLNMIVSMRSNDFFWGLQYDLFRFTLLQEVIANEIGLDVGWYYHFDGSLHVYEYHYEMLENIKEMKPVNMPSYNLHLVECSGIIRQLGALTVNADVAIGNDFIKILATKFFDYKDIIPCLPEWTSDFIKI